LFIDPSPAFKADPVVVAIEGKRRVMAEIFLMISFPFRPALFRFRTGQPFSSRFFRICMQAAAPCTG